MSKDKKLAEQLGDDGLEHLERALAIDGKYAAALAVKGGIQGMMISLRPNSMMTLGPQSGAHLSRALSLAPGDPRIHLLNGIGILHKPVMFGGGPRPSLEEFRQAQELFAKESVADSTQPDWGGDDAWVWEGRAAMELKDYAGARAAFQHALQVNPDNGWVRTQLLPAAEKALGGKGADKSAADKGGAEKPAAEGGH
jgi:tetratricopeptide (TPR) repeat protein